MFIFKKVFAKFWVRITIVHLLVVFSSEPGDLWKRQSVQVTTETVERVLFLETVVILPYAAEVDRL